ncbi:uncharacterized protein LOC116166168 isoform X2 [Photinus pyralis]|uniref:uncharacterized protein LOC116166168 isoform X2 n=1 Tax=Photinus pyralis TaxID=7054 RepID=UPI001266E5C5|nr:uncharacterized protein LOC116166168 isoform X2 [Photinus pyralis]
MPSINFIHLDNLHCSVCKRPVKLVPVRYMALLYRPNFSFRALLKVMFKSYKFFVCSLCCTLVRRAAILQTDYTEMFNCLVCRKQDCDPFAYLDDYDNPLFRPKEDVLYFKTFVHKRCLVLSDGLQKVYSVIESNNWAQLKKIVAYRKLTSYLCAPILIPTLIPRPFGTLLQKLPKLEIEVEEIERQMKMITLN